MFALSPGATISPDTQAAGPVSLGDGVEVLAGVRFGKFSLVNAWSTINEADIGNYVSIGEYVRINVFNTHPIDWLSTHPFQVNDAHFSDVPGYRDIHRIARAWHPGKMLIGHDVWIGSHAKLLNAVSIGIGAVVGAAAVVTDDVPPFAIVGGVPARVIRYRFDEKTITRLLASRWWELDPWRLSGVPFNDISLALDEIERRNSS